MAICGCGSPACCCQPAVAGGVIYADLRVSLALTWPCRRWLLRFLLCRSLCYKLSPFQALGEVTLHPLSQACVFVYSSCGKRVFPPLPWSFLPTAAFTSFPAPGCWAMLLLLPSPAWLVYLQFWKGFLFSPLRSSGRPTLFAMCLFCYCFSVSLFFPRWGLVCPGGYADLAQGCLWEYHIPLNSLCGLRLPKLSGCWRLAVGRPSWFLLLT
jgi:hypothetical protein